MISDKLIQRWASIYVAKLLKDKNEAREWSHRFLPQEYTDAVALHSKTILKKKGYKVLE